jgi:hypothetical protein
MEHYVTLFDSLFLPQGLALHMSMERHVKSYCLWILCVDDVAYEALKKLQLPNVMPLQLSKLESSELLRIKPTRSKAEYCWTLTPFAPKFVFEADPTVDRVTYLDADLWFRADPAEIFCEFIESGKSVLITEHAYAPEYDQSSIAGKYCVQFMIFSKMSSEIVRKWWEDRCIEWCFARYEEGKFGDQKYLDQWPDLFGSFVHVLQNRELILAPWNATRFPYTNSLVWHFHALRLTEIKPKRLVYLGEYKLYQTVLINIYNPYLSDFIKSINHLSINGIDVLPQFKLSFISHKILILKLFIKRMVNFNQAIIKAL